jgi:muramidase (phage lysozyme)
MTKFSPRDNQINSNGNLWFKAVFMLVILLGLSTFWFNKNKIELKKASQYIIAQIYYSAPLTMDGGNPYLRALMRTISVSEANYLNPYYVIYGGKHVENLTKHPDICVTIIRGPNEGKCTTASGRYQFLNSTWAEKAKKYHPQPTKFLLWSEYSFEPLFQDIVLYNWLNDSQAWGVDIKQLLEQGEIDEVLKLLSSTWTSLGYGIEDNIMTKHLPTIYRKILKEELANSQQNSVTKVINH